MIKKVDMVIPYVNNKDKVWLKTFVDYCKKHGLVNKIIEMRGNRYDCGDLVSYQLKLIKKNMPFINKIYLLLSNKEQKPLDLDNDVVVVLHKEFIPYRFLPTFNSTTIEMFLWNIPNLSEYFIYANDDMLPTGKLSLDDFFSESGIIKINMTKDTLLRNNGNFKYQCMNSYKHILEAQGHKVFNNEYMKPIHSFTPMIKSHCEEAYNSIKEEIDKNIRAFRNDYQHNQYIYPIYEMVRYGIYDNDIDFKYEEIYNEEDIDFTHQIVCINEIPNQKLYNVVLERLDQLLCE